MTVVQGGVSTDGITKPDTLEAVILDVGHGNCAILREGDTCVIVDAKSDKLLYQELIDSGVRRIEHLVLSHADTDHIAGALRLLPNTDFEIGTVWVNSDSAKDSMKWDELLRLLTRLRREDRFRVRMGISDLEDWELSLKRILIDVLHPTLSDIGHGTGKKGKVRPEITTNGMSVVLRVLMDGQPALLLPGDLDTAGLHQMLGRTKPVTAHVLVYPHHGGHSGEAQEGDFARSLCSAVQPEVILFSMGRSAFRNPLPEVVAEIANSFSHARIACTQLSPNCHAGAPPAGPPLHLLTPAAGHSENQCCAGTVRISVTADGEISVVPHSDEHQSWIRSNVSDPMCISKPQLPRQRSS
ncbi:ComEC/Rec2 family competence protein [Streptomyces collinus]|uniref:ComEC/Rec2 family competence protein n=1 Tax=Streptomyces collinus TaxID=42684 RepID=UPI0037F9C9F6